MASLSSSPGMFICGCGRSFSKSDALEDHKQARVATICKNSSPSPVSAVNNHVSGLQSSPSVDGPLITITSGSAKPKWQVKRDKWMVKGIGRIVETIEASLLQPAETLVTSSTSYELLCSYNWTNRKSHTIYVPGGPPIWKDMSLPITIPEDSGTHFIDQDAARLPKYPFQVVFQAAEMMRPNLCFDMVDILANRNTMRKLLDFCHGRNQDSFRINLYMVQNTLIIERCEKDAKKMIYGSDRSGYGRNFESEFTESLPDLKGSCGHHRVLQYDLGHLSCAIRFEVDSYYEIPSQIRSPTKKEVDSKTGDENISISHSFDSLATNASTSNSKESSNSTVSVIPRGIIMAQSNMAEIKTRTKPGSLSKFLPQLWFGRTNYLITGYHTNGVFENIEIRHVQDLLRDWERKEANQTALRKLASLLSQLRESVQNTKENSAIAIFEHGAKPVALQIYVPKQRREPLPKYIIDKFWRNNFS